MKGSTTLIIMIAIILFLLLVVALAINVSVNAHGATFTANWTLPEFKGLF